MNQQRNIWNQGGADEKMDEDKEETDNEDVGDEEQNEDHQKARALASPDLPSRREVEDHSLTHVPFTIWCNHCLGGRGRRSARKWSENEGEGMDNRAVTPYSVDYVYLTEEGTEDESDAEEGMARGSTTLERPMIVCVERKTGGAHAHQVKCKGSGVPWVATRIAADIEELRCGRSRVVLKAAKEVAIAHVQRQVVAERSGETVSMNSAVGESQSNGRVENAVQRVQGQRRLNTRILSSNTIFPCMVEFSARGNDAQAPVEEFGKKIMYMTAKNKRKSALKVDAKFHDGVWLGLGMKSDESITGVPNGVIKAKTVRRFPEDQRRCAEEVLSMRGIPSNPVLGVGRDHIPTEVNGSWHAERGEEKQDQHKGVRGVTLARQLLHRPDSEEKVHNQIARQRMWRHRGMSRMQGDRSRQINASQQRMQNEDKGEMEQSEEGRDGLKAEEQRQHRHLEKAVMRSVSSDPDLSRAEDEAQAMAGGYRARRWSERE